MSNGSFDYSKMTEKQILLLVVQRLDSLDGLPKRVASLERWRSWFSGVGATITALFTLFEARHHG